MTPECRRELAAATDLISGGTDTNGGFDVFLWDRLQVHRGRVAALGGEIALLGGDVSPFVSTDVAKLLKQRAKDLGVKK